MEFKEWLNEKIKEHGLNSQSLADAIGENQATIYRIISGETKNPRLKIIKKLEDYFKLEHSTSQVEENVINLREKLNEVPKISWVQAGDMCETEDYYEPGVSDDWVICPVKHGARTYVLEVVGDSMNSGDMDGYIEGFDIFVDPDIEPKHGDDVIVRTLDNKATFKRLQLSDEGKYLLALNKTWPNRIIEVPEGTVFCGVVIYSGKSRKK